LGNPIWATNRGVNSKPVLKPPTPSKRGRLKRVGKKLETPERPKKGQPKEIKKEKIRLGKEKYCSLFGNGYKPK